MKRILLPSLVSFCSIILLSLNANAQIAGAQDLFCETFDTIPWKMTTSATPINAASPFEVDSNVTKDMSRYSASDTVGTTVVNTGGTPIVAKAFLTSPNVSIEGYTSVGISFDHICYIEQFDDGAVEFSFDNGSTWSRLPQSTYRGQSFYKPDNSFSKISRAQLWRFGDTSYVFTSNTNAWVRENFDLTPLLSVNNDPDSVRIRFVLEDDPSSDLGNQGTHRWWIDNFCIRGADCELVPPTIDLTNPPANYPDRYEDRVYWLGPYDFTAQLKDNRSGIGEAFIEYRVTRCLPAGPNCSFVEVRHDTIYMTDVGSSFYEVDIPESSTQLGDSVYWRIVVKDGSACENTTQSPPSGFESFEVRGNLPKACNTQPIFNFPYVQDFESNDFVADNSGVLAEDWINTEGDFHNWWVRTGAAPDYPNTGPDDDFPGGGKYLYVESTGYPDSTASLLTPCLDLFETENALVRFYINMNTNGLEDTIRVDYFDPDPQPGFPDGKFITDVITPIPGNKGNNWLPYEFSTYPFRNKVTQFRFRATPDANPDGLGDMALDSFKIVPAPLTDMRLDQVVETPFNPAGEEDTVELIVQNLGVFDANNIDFYYQVNEYIDETNFTPGPVVGPINWSGTIAPSGIERIRFENNRYVVPEGNYFIKAWLTFANDTVHPNDTSFSNSLGLRYVSPDCQKDFFDGDTVWITTSRGNDLKNNWELGSPNYDVTNTAYSEPNSWDVLLNKPYTGTGRIIDLVSPFFDMRGKDSLIMAFMNNRDMDENKDGVFIEYSFDKGITWDSLPATRDPKKKQWYNGSLSGGALGGTPVFTGATREEKKSYNGWLESELLLPDTFKNQKNALFRFRFFAEEDEDGNDGMSIDNFLVYDPEPFDVEIFRIVEKDYDCYLTTTERLKAIYKNRGEEDITSFEVEYIVENLITGVVQTATQVINKGIPSRDTIHVTSTPTFDLKELGDYKLTVITNLQNDGCRLNDTLVKYIENVDGCDLVLEILTNPKPIRDSSYWRFNYKAAGRDYVVESPYAYMTPSDTFRTDVCIKKGARVTFDLGDIDTNVNNYSLYAFNGERDTTIIDRISGGTDSPIQTFNWLCPPDTSASAIDIILDNNDVQLPLPKDYLIDVEILNNGLDSIDFVKVGLQIDQTLIEERTVVLNNPPRTGGLEYNRREIVNFGLHYLAPGIHTITAWTHAPNGRVDEIPEDDTISITYAIIDSIDTRRPSGEYCADFEDGANKDWVALNAITYSQRDIGFERGSPSTTNIPGANSGSKAWVTNADGNYKRFDSSSVVSPVFNLERDSCYVIEFFHNYYFDDLFHDGAHIQLTSDSGRTWRTLNNLKGGFNRNGTGDTALQQGWYNTAHIASIPNRSTLNTNSGWTGKTNGYVKAMNFIPSYEDSRTIIRWRFGSDGDLQADGWAIDDFCIKRSEPSNCFAVGLDEDNIDMSRFYVGQNIPNPTYDRTEIPVYLPEGGEVNIQVSNLIGQVVLNNQIVKSRGNHLLEVDLSSLESGIYYYTVLFEESRRTKKMIIVDR